MIGQLHQTIFSLLLVAIIKNACIESPKKPTALSSFLNIVLIVTDDLGYGDWSINEQTFFDTSNIDYLANHGKIFTQHYSGFTVCAPSRSSLVTGLYTWHTFIRGYKIWSLESQYPLSTKSITIAQLLQEVGYKTGAFGKWGLGYPGSEGEPNNQGFDEFFGYDCQRLGRHYYPYHSWHNDDKIILDESIQDKNGTFGPEIIHEYAPYLIEQINLASKYPCIVND